jgi:hypothetical protein
MIWAIGTGAALGAILLVRLFLVTYNTEFTASYTPGGIFLSGYAKLWNGSGLWFC